MNRRMRVAIVDDHEVVGLAIGSLVAQSESLEFAGSATSVADLIASGRHADLVLLDLNLRDSSQPTDNVAALRSWGAAVLAFTSGENPYLIREAARADVLGILRKSTPLPTILSSIESAAAGEAVITADWAAALDSDREIETARLTKREREVLALYASGLGAKSVAVELGLSEHTVDDYIRQIRRKYGLLGRLAHTKVDLYQRGLEDGFLPLPTDT